MGELTGTWGKLGGELGRLEGIRWNLNGFGNLRELGGTGWIEGDLEGIKFGEQHGGREMERNLRELEGSRKELGGTSGNFGIFRFSDRRMVVRPYGNTTLLNIASYISMGVARRYQMDP